MVEIIVGVFVGLILLFIVVTKFAEVFPRFGRIVERWLPGEDDDSPGDT